jgi:hypothetical protein
MSAAPQLVGPVREPEFSLRALVREVRDELATGDKFVIAKETLHRIPPGQREAALLEALAEVARVVVNEAHPRIHQVPAGPAKGAGQVNSARSAKVTAMRRMWPQLRATYACLDSNKQLGDYGADDLVFVAAHLEVQASQNAAKATQYRNLSALLPKYKVAKVRELPDAVLTAVFTGEAA